ncbi:MAG: hypothetical protein VXZ82_08920 [Planctomycetota bacterium]|nr:hypothetical protein [Planctomycetota bacterium]
MNACELVEAIQEIRPDHSPSDHLRIALLLTLKHDNVQPLEATDALEDQLQDIQLQLSLHHDQHAAVAGELDSLAATAPTEFSPQHLWTLVRALKVQGQMLNMYLG